MKQHNFRFSNSAWENTPVVQCNRTYLFFDWLTKSHDRQFPETRNFPCNSQPIRFNTGNISVFLFLILWCGFSQAAQNNCTAPLFNGINCHDYFLMVLFCVGLVPPSARLCKHQCNNTIYHALSNSRKPKQFSIIIFLLHNRSPAWRGLGQIS